MSQAGDSVAGALLAAPRPDLDVHDMDEIQVRLGWPSGRDPAFDKYVIDWLTKSSRTTV